jgi:hypothetical protein
MTEMCTERGFVPVASPARMAVLAEGLADRVERRAAATERAAGEPGRDRSDDPERGALGLPVLPRRARGARAAAPAQPVGSHDPPGPQVN